MGHPVPVAYFDMNVRAPSFLRVYEMLCEVERRFGQHRGHTHITTTIEGGRYFILFFAREAADMFEKLLRDAIGRTPQRLRRLPEDMAILDEAMMLVIMSSPEKFVRYMRAHLN